jgi:hypothetical protein
LTRGRTRGDELGETFCCEEGAVGEECREGEREEIEGRFVVNGSESCVTGRSDLLRGDVVFGEIGVERGLFGWNFLWRRLKLLGGFEKGIGGE